MTTAQQAISALADWIKASSRSRRSPLGDSIGVGPFAVLVPQPLDQAPAPTFEAEALPLWIPETQSPGDLPPIDTESPKDQDHKQQRLQHIVWMTEQGRLPSIKLIDLTNPSTPLQSVLDQQVPGLNLDQTAVVFLPRW